MSAVQALFAPFNLGNLQLSSRVVMAPMTRSFSPGGVPNAKVVEYYRRRAAAGVGLIVTEGTTVGHKAANGYPHVPRFYGEDALAGWKQVVDAVHAEGGKIVPQLWHVGNVRRLGSEPEADVPGYGPMEKLKDGQEVVHGMSQADAGRHLPAGAHPSGGTWRHGGVWRWPVHLQRRAFLLLPPRRAHWPLCLADLAAGLRPRGNGSRPMLACHCAIRAQAGRRSA